MATIIKQHTKVNFTNVTIPVKYIVIHDTGVLGQTAKNNADYFEKTYRGASAHYFVDKTSIYEVVEDGKKAWHVGDDKDDSDGINNGNTTGIELCAEKDGTFHPNTIANGAWLTQTLMKKRNVPSKNVVRHYDASGKNCPQRMNVDGKWSLWYKYHKQLTGATSASVPLPSNSNKQSQHIVKAGDTLWGLSKQYNATIAELKKWNNLRSDVIVVGTKLNLGTNVTVPTPNPTPVVSTPVAVDSTGNSVVKTIQKTVGVAEDGWDGPNTRKGVVKLFQRYFGANADGYIGNETLNKSKVIRSGDKGWHVYAIQAMLYLKGYTSVGTPDQMAGPKFVQAVKNFQKDNKLGVDGTPGKQTYAKLLKL